MKKSLFVAAIAALAVVACKKSETVETPAADSAAATVDSAAATVDSAAAKVDSAAAKVDSAAAKVEAAAPEAKK